MWKERAENEEFEFNEPGDSITGMILTQKTCFTEFGESKVYTIVDENYDTFYFFGCNALDVLLPRMIGRVVKITYKGKSDLKGGRTFHNYSVCVWATKDGKPPKGFEHLAGGFEKRMARPTSSSSGPDDDDNNPPPF